MGKWFDFRDLGGGKESGGQRKRNRKRKDNAEAERTLRIEEVSDSSGLTWRSSLWLGLRFI